MASASPPASELAVQLPATASSLAVPPPAASIAEEVDLSVGSAILEDAGSGAAVAVASAATHPFFIFSYLPLVYCSCIFAFLSYFAGIPRVRSCTWMYEVLLSLLLYPA